MKTCPMTFLFVSVVYLINYFKEMTIPLCKKVFNASKMISKYFFVTKTFIKCTVQVNNDTVSSDRLSTDKYDRLSTDKYLRNSLNMILMTAVVKIFAICSFFLCGYNKIVSSLKYKH